MDSAQWPQVAVKSMEEEEEGRRAVVEIRKAKPGKDQILNCPRCNSINTKFCYYNNYSLSQPRYFCKSCRRYWTAGGSLRNIPVGGASRKNKRPSPNFSSSSSAADPSNISSPKNNKINNDGDDDDDDHHQSNPIIISYGSSKLSNMVNNTASSSFSSNSNSNATTSCCWLSSDHHMNQMLRSNGMSQRELIPFMPMPAAAAQPTSMCTTVADHCNPSRNNNNNNNNGLFEVEGGKAARRLFNSTVEDFKQLPPTIISADQNGAKLGDHVPAFWNGIFGGGSW